MLAPYIEGHSPELRALGVRGLAAYEPFLSTLAEVAAPPEYRRTGTLQAAFDDEGARELTELARLLADAGVAHRRLDGSAARALEPGLSTRVIAALEIAAHGYVSAEGLVAALVEGAVSYGAQFSAVRVTAIAGGAAPRVEARSDSATEFFEGDAVVLAAGSWVSELPTSLDSPDQPPPTVRTNLHPEATNLPRQSAVRPIRGQLLRLKACPPIASRVLWGPGCYIVPRQDGTVLVGATVEDVGFDERATLGGVRTLVDAAASLAPGLESASLEDVRVGLRPATADELPIIGPSATMPQIFYAAGHYRSGVLLAPLTAGLIADLVLGRRAGPELDALRPARFGL